MCKQRVNINNTSLLQRSVSAAFGFDGKIPFKLGLFTFISEPLYTRSSSGVSRSRSVSGAAKWSLTCGTVQDDAKLIIADVNPGAPCQVSWIYLLKTFNWDIYLSEGRKGIWSKIYALPLRRGPGYNGCQCMQKEPWHWGRIWRRGELYIMTRYMVSFFVRDASWVLSRQRNFAKSLAAVFQRCLKTNL